MRRRQAPIAQSGSSRYTATYYSIRCYGSKEQSKAYRHPNSSLRLQEVLLCEHGIWKATTVLHLLYGFIYTHRRGSGNGPSMAWHRVLAVDYMRGFPTNINSVAIILAVWRVLNLVLTPLQSLTARQWGISCRQTAEQWLIHH